MRYLSGLFIFGWMLLASAPIARAGMQDTVIKNAIPGEPRPAVIFLHGGNSNGAIMDAYVDIDKELIPHNVVSIYPTGYNGFWNDGVNVTPRNDVGYLDSMIDYYAAKRMIDPSRLYLAGISNGGLMIQRMLCASRYNFDGAAIVGATHPGLHRCSKAKPTPMIFFYGDKDTFFPPDGMPGNAWHDKFKPVGRNDTIAFWARVNGCHKSPSPYQLPGATDSLKVTSYMFDDCQVPLLVYNMDGVGHVWPGAKSTPAAASSLGPNPSGFSANQAIISAWFGR